MQAVVVVPAELPSNPTMAPLVSLMSLIRQPLMPIKVDREGAGNKKVAVSILSSLKKLSFQMLFFNFITPLVYFSLKLELYLNRK